MKLRKYEYPSNYVVPPTFACRHWAEEVFANRTESLEYICGQKNYKILTDEQEAVVRDGRQIPEADGYLSHPYGGRCSVMVCSDCYDAGPKAVAARAREAYIAEHGAPPPESQLEAVAPVEELLEELVAA